MLRQLPKLTSKHLSNKRIAINTFAFQQQAKRFESSGTFAKSSKSDFRHIGTEKDAGALQDLLRRVMEIDADITQTPIVEFKPNTQICTAYCIDDEFSLDDMAKRLPFENYYVSNAYDNMLHISNTLHGGDIYLFNNGTLTFWGLDQNNQDWFLNNIRQQKNTLGFHEAKETVEYTIDEDEVTDMKGDIMILNPFIPSVDLSKIAFSYGLGRAAKLTSIEASIKQFLTDIASLPATLCDSNATKELFSNRSLTGKLLFIQQRMINGSRDGLLGTPDFHWAKPELEGYVNKISTRFDVSTRIAILNKQLDYAKNVVDTAKEHDLLK